MYHIIERNKRRNRRSALFLAVVLHFALAAFLYVQASAKSTPTSDLAQTTVKSTAMKNRVATQP